MPNYNKVILMGNLTRDVAVRQAGQSNVADFGIAINRKFKDKEETTFVDCEAWGTTADNIAKFFSKGRPIHVEGRLKLDQWEKDGVKQSKLRVVVDSFEFVNSNGANGEGGTEGEATAAKAKGRPKKVNETVAAAAAAGTDDIPF